MTAPAVCHLCGWDEQLNPILVFSTSEHWSCIGTCGIADCPMKSTDHAAPQIEGTYEAERSGADVPSAQPKEASGRPTAVAACSTEQICDAILSLPFTNSSDTYHDAWQIVRAVQTKLESRYGNGLDNEVNWRLAKLIDALENAEE